MNLAKAIVKRLLEGDEEPQSFLDRQLPMLRGLPNFVEPENVDAIEIHPLRRYVDDLGWEQVEQTTRQDANSYGVFVHLIKPGGIDDATTEDFKTPEEASRYANVLSKQFGWPIHDYAK